MNAVTTSILDSADLVRQAFDALNRKDLAFVRKFWNAETVEQFPDRTCRGDEEIAKYFSEVFAAIPDWNIRIVDLAAQGDHVFVQWHLTGTHQGTLLGVAATGKPLAIDGMDHFVIRNGMVVSNFVVFDQLAFARQIGLMPPDGSPVDRTLKAAFGAATMLLRSVTR